MRRRAATHRGFTLLEVLVALAVSGLVVLLAYGTLTAATDAEARVVRAHQAVRREAAARVLLGDALRHAVAEARLDGGGWRLEPTADGATTVLAFVSRGIQVPHGATARWQVTVQTTPRGVFLEAVPLEAPGPTLVTPLGASAMRVEVLDRASGTWGTAWRDASRLPDAVAIAWRGESDAVPPLVARLSPAVAP